MIIIEGERAMEAALLRLLQRDNARRFSEGVYRCVQSVYALGWTAGLCIICGSWPYFLEILFCTARCQAQALFRRCS